MVDSQHGLCGLCGEPLEHYPMRAHHVDHIRPLAEGGTDTRDNVHLTHALCNARKGADTRLRASGLKDFKRTTLSIDDDTHAALKWLRRYERVSASALLREAVSEELTKQGMAVHRGEVVSIKEKRRRESNVVNFPV